MNVHVDFFINENSRLIRLKTIVKYCVQFKPKENKLNEYR